MPVTEDCIRMDFINKATRIVLDNKMIEWIACVGFQPFICLIAKTFIALNLWAYIRGLC